MFGYFELYYLPYKIIKNDMTTEQKIVYNLINENVFLQHVKG